MALDLTDAEQVRQVVQQAHAHFGKLDVVLNNAEPGAYVTEFGASGKRVPEMDVYTAVRKQVFTRLSNEKCGNAQATAEAVLKIVDAAEPPLRFALGSEILPMARGTYADRLATWEAWESVSNAAQGSPMQ